MTVSIAKPTIKLFHKCLSMFLNKFWGIDFENVVYFYQSGIICLGWKFCVYGKARVRIRLYFRDAYGLVPSGLWNGKSFSEFQNENKRTILQNILKIFAWFHNIPDVTRNLILLNSVIPQLWVE